MQERAADSQHGSFGVPLQQLDVDGSCASPHRSISSHAPLRLRLEALLEPPTQEAKQFWTLRDSVTAALSSWPEDFLWRDLCLATQVLPDLSSELRSLLGTCPPWQGEPVLQAHVFTDGSASAYTHAAWSLVVVFECLCPGFEHSGFYFHRFAGSTLQPFESWIRHGTNVGEMIEDALSAEMAGLIWAFGWALQDQWIHPTIFTTTTCQQETELLDFGLLPEARTMPL